MTKIGKRLKNAYKNIKKEQMYSLTDALKTVKENAKAKFDETIDVAIKLGIDGKKSDQTVRGVINLPNGTGKTYKVAVFAKGEKAEAAKKAGADVVGEEDLVDQVLKGNFDFEKCIATPDMMPVLSKAAKVLGPKGMMPNPKLGTVTEDVAKAVKDAKAGQVEYRAEKNGIVHAGVGKASFDDKKLEENVKALVDAVNKAKPEGVKGTYLKGIALSSTMGVGVKVDIASLS
jgi:large subunit ribosomal protein L1